MLCGPCFPSCIHNKYLVHITRRNTTKDRRVPHPVQALRPPSGPPSSCVCASTEINSTTNIPPNVCQCQDNHAWSIYLQRKTCGEMLPKRRSFSASRPSNPRLVAAVYTRRESVEYFVGDTQMTLRGMTHKKAKTLQEYRGNYSE